MKTALVTGASRGIGLSISNKLKAVGIKVIPVSQEDFDLSDYEQVENFLNLNKDLHVDILINNAGINIISKIDSLSFSDWNRVLNVNLNSVFLLTKFFIAKMEKNKSGYVLNISSAYSFLGRAGRSAYASSKAALNSFTRVCAIEYGSSNILVNSLSPGFVDTEMTHKNNTKEMIQEIAEKTALKRLARPDEIAELAYFLVSDKNTYITGQNIVIDGGFSIQ